MKKTLSGEALHVLSSSLPVITALSAVVIILFPLFLLFLVPLASVSTPKVYLELLEVTNVHGYTILRTLGEGGEGVLYEARHHGSGEVVALKVTSRREAELH